MSREYDSAAVFVIVGGVPLVEFAEGSKVLCIRNADAYTMQMGSDGFGTRSKSNDKSGRMTVRLKSSRPSNDVLTAFADADENIPGGAVLPFMCKDTNGTSQHTAASSWIVKRADADYDQESGEREWIFETDVLSHRVGSNNQSAQNPNV